MHVFRQSECSHRCIATCNYTQCIPTCDYLPAAGRYLHTMHTYLRLPTCSRQVITHNAYLPATTYLRQVGIYTQCIPTCDYIQISIQSVVAGMYALCVVVAGSCALCVVVAGSYASVANRYASLCITQLKHKHLRHNHIHTSDAGPQSSADNPPQKFEILSKTYLPGEVGGWGRVPLERWGAGVEYHFQEFNEPYAPS